MKNSTLQRRSIWWALIGVGGLGLVLGCGYIFLSGGLSAKAAAQTENDDDPPPTTNEIHVQVVRPKKGELDRSTTQPGSVIAFESVEMYAGASGFLKTLNVDIGDEVKKGQVLAQVDVPDLEKQVQRNLAVVEQATAKVKQMVARAASARADWEAAKASVPRAEAMLKSKQAELLYRQKQLDRNRQLARVNVIEDKLVDEYTSHRDAVREAELAAREGVTAAKANVEAMAAKILAADADIAEAEAEKRVAQAELEKAQVMVKFATISAPFDGVVTRRNYFPKDFVRAATEGGDHLPVLTVQRTDKLRVVVQIPDRDVPYCDVGDPALVEIDALPGQKVAPAKVSRIAHSEDHDTRLMHVEIDLPNPTGKICNGMYGRVTIMLDKSDYLSVPSTCIVDRTNEGKGFVYVVRDGHAKRTPVAIGADNGLHTAITSGVKETDEIIMNPESDIVDGTAVNVVASEAEPKLAHGR